MLQIVDNGHGIAVSRSRKTKLTAARRPSSAVRAVRDIETSTVSRPRVAVDVRLPWRSPRQHQLLLSSRGRNETAVRVMRVEVCPLRRTRLTTGQCLRTVPWLVTRDRQEQTTAQ